MTKTAGHVCGVLCILVVAAGAMTHRVEESTTELIRLTLAPSIDDSVWCGWIGLPPKANVAAVEVRARGRIRPAPWSSPASGAEGPSVRVGPAGLLRFHRVVPVRARLAASTPEGTGLPEQVEVILRLQGASRAAAGRRGFGTLLPHLIVNWDQAQGWVEDLDVPDPPARVPAPSVRVLVRDEGLYRLTYEDLQPLVPGTDALDTRRLALWNRGELTPIRVVSATTSWQPGDWLEFYGHGAWREDPQGRWVPKESKYTRDNAYYFVWDAIDPPRIRDVDASSQGGTPAAFGWWPCHREADTFPSISGHRGAIDDEWYWGGPFYPGEVAKTFSLADLLPDGPGARVRARLMAISDDTTVTLDHHVTLLVNGTPVGSASWGGYGPQIVDGEGALLQSGQNQFTIQSTGIPISGLQLDYFAVLYPRLYEASAGQNVFGPSATGIAEYRVSGLAPGVAVDVFEVPAGVRLTRFANVPGSDGAVRFHHAFADTSRILLVPSTAWKGASDLAAPLSPVLARPPLVDSAHEAQYLVIYGADELEAAAGFRDFHRARGDAASAEIVAVQDVWDEFSFGMLSPPGLRHFLQWAVANWSDPPEFVLLLGDGTWDYNGYMAASASANIVPSFGNPASDNFYASLNDTSFYPDIYLGRIPALNGSQAATSLAKVQAYVASPSHDLWRKRTLFVTGGATVSDFNLYRIWISLLHNMAIKPPPIMGTVTTVSKDVEGYWPGVYNSLVRAAIDSGCVIVDFFGHGASETWDYMLDSGDALLLQNGVRMPFVLSPTCFTGDFADPRDTVFAEHFLRLDDAQHGAIGFFGSSGTSYLTEGLEYAWALFNHLFRTGDPRMGPAITAAKLSSWPWPSDVDSVMASVYNLLGDPLLAVVFPTDPDLHIDAASASFSPSEPAASDSITMLVSVTNEGTAWSSPVTGVVERDGMQLTSARFTPDSLTSRVPFRWQAPASPGTETLWIRLDPDGAVPDPDPTDNDLQVTLTLLRPRPEPLMPMPDAMVPGPAVSLIAYPVGDEGHHFEVATSDTFGSTVVGSSSDVLPQGGTVTWSWQTPSQGVFCWRVKVDGGAWSLPRWFTVAPPDSGWAQSQSAQFATLELSSCEASALGLSLAGSASTKDYATLSEGARVDSVSSFNASACGPENLIGGTTWNTDWGGSFYFFRLDQDQWAIIDLGQERMIKRLASAHETQLVTKRAVWSYFGIESSTDGLEFIDWGHTADYTDSGYGSWIASYVAYEKPDPIPVRYVRYRYGKCHPFGPVYEGARVYEVYAFQASYPESGWALSPPIGPAASWVSLASEGVAPSGTDATIRILIPAEGDQWEVAGTSSLGATESLSWLSGPEAPRIRLRVSFRSLARDVTPHLTSWRVAYATIADLSVDPDTVLVNPVVPVPGSVAMVTTRITNAGSDPVASARYVLAIQDEGGSIRTLADSATAWLAPGASVSVGAPWEAVGGVFRFTLTVDPTDVVAEADEGNNTAFGEVRVLGNLTWHDSVAIAPVAPAPSETLTVSAAALNDGVLDLAPARAACTWRGHPDTAWAVTTALAPGQVAAIHWRIAAPPEPTQTMLRLVVDPDSLLQEITKADNAIEIPVTIMGFADPVIVRVRPDCATPPLGDAFSIEVDLVNGGERPTGPMVLSCTQTGGWTERLDVASLDPSESTTVSVLWPTGEELATLSFLFVLDPDSLLADADRSNNTGWCEVTTVRAPDLVLQGVTIDPALPLAGEGMMLTTGIRNRGIVDAAAFLVRLRGDDQQEHLVASLSGQRTTDLAWALVPPAPGTHRLTLTIDVENSVAEACEGNNEATLSFLVGLPWDLALSDEDLQRLDPAQPFVAWDSVALAVTVRNAGDEASPEASIELYDGLPDGAGLAVDSAHIAPLSPGAIDTLRLWWPAGRTPGSHVMTGLIDPRNEHGEWNRSNNRATRTIDVLADTVPPQVEISPPWPGFVSGGYLGPSDSLTVRAWDALSGVGAVSLFLDGGLLDPVAPKPDTSTGTPGVRLRAAVPGSPGAHTLLARAEDRAGLASEAHLAYVIPGALAISDVAAFPSPASGPTWITARVSMTGQFTVSIYAPSGRLVRILEAPASHPGRAAVQWDLRDQDGDRVANGVYLVRATISCADAAADAKGSLVVRR